MTQLGKEFSESGNVSDEAIEKLSAMDSKDLVQAYLKYNANTTAAALQQNQINEIMTSVGGADAVHRDGDLGQPEPACRRSR